MSDDVKCRNCHENSGLVRDVAADVYGGPRVVWCWCTRGISQCDPDCPCAPVERQREQIEGWNA